MFEEYTDQNIDIYPPGKIFRIVFDNTVNKFKLMAKSYDEFVLIRKAFSTPNTSAFFVKQYGYSNIENDLYAINKFGYFAPGLIFEVLDYIKNQFGNLNVLAISKNFVQYVEDYLTPLKKFFRTHPEGLSVKNIADDSGRNAELALQGKKYEFRDYQENSVLAWLKTGYGRGIIEIPTSGGKSFIISNFIYNIFSQIDESKKFKYLILVPNKQLVAQFYGDLIDYGLDRKMKITKFTAGLKKSEKYNPDADIIIANRQYIFNNLNLLPKIDVLICDEIHQCVAEATQNLIEKLNCKIRVGCSGTVPRDKWNRWQLIGMFSKLVYAEEITDLQKRGYITDLKINLIKVVDKNVRDNKDLLFNINSTRKYRTEDEYSDITFDSAHNAEIEYMNKYCKELYTPILPYVDKLKGNALILFDRIEFGTNMFKIAQEQLVNRKCVYIDGSIDVKTREEIRAEIETRDDMVVFGQSSCVSTGLNFKNLPNIVFFTGGKSFSRVIQAIGRTLRLHANKDCSNILDISFNFKYSHRHLLERLKIYQEMYHKKPDNIIKIEI